MFARNRKSSFGISFAVLAATIGVVLLNVTDPTWFIGGQSIATVSDAHPTLITPAGYAFSIWGLIFCGLLSFAAYQMLPAVREQAVLRAIRKPYLASCAAVAAWVVLWRHEWVGCAFFTLAALVASLAIIYIRLDYRPMTSSAERWMVRAPLTMYLAWTTVACAVNAAAALSAWGFGAGAPQFWAVATLGLLAGIGAAVALRQGDATFAATFTWAFAAIAVSSTNSSFLPGAPLVATVAALGAGAVLLSLWIGRYTGEVEERTRQQNGQMPLSRTNYV